MFKSRAESTKRTFAGVVLDEYILVLMKGLEGFFQVLEHVVRVRLVLGEVNEIEEGADRTNSLGVDEAGKAAQQLLGEWAVFVPRHGGEGANAVVVDP